MYNSVSNLTIFNEIISLEKMLIKITVVIVTFGFGNRGRRGVSFGKL